MSEQTADAALDERALLDLVRAVHSSSDLEVSARIVADGLREALACDGATVMRVRDGHLEVIGAAGMLAPVRGLALPVDQVGAARSVLDTCRPVALPDTLEHPHWKPVPGGERIRSWLAAPWMVDNQALGILEATAYRENQFGTSETKYIDALAQYVGPALHQVQLLEETRRKLREMSHSPPRAARAQADLDQALQTIAEEAQELTGAGHAFVFVLEATGRHLRCAAAAGDKQRQLRTMVLQADASLGSTSGVSQMVPGWFRKGNPNQAHLTALGIRVGPVLPLRAHGQMVGFLGVGTNHHSQRLPGEALSLLAFLSSRASLEIERLQPSVADRLDYEAAVRSAPQGICVLRAGGEILAANPAVGTMVGRDPWDLAGESWRHLLPDGEWQRLQHVLEDVSITGERKDLDIEIRTEQNYRRQIRFSLALTTPAGPGLQDRGRGPDKIVAILEDVTSLRILEQERLAHLEELRQKNVALQELDRLKSQFVSNVSHELRNPLAVIKLYSALARKGRPDKQDHYLQTIERETHRLETLVENVLSLSRLDRGALELNLEPLNVSTIVQNVVDVYQVSARAKGIELQNRVTPPTPTLWADESQLIQILTNLLDNALKFTPAGGEVWIDAAQAGEPVQPLLEISVGDTGPGIPPDEQDKVFERFYRGKNSSPTTSGTGIGLSIVREMMEQHGGQVLLDSPPGEGCTFRLLFSLADPSN